mgnify:CR=1 FL=1
MSIAVSKEVLSVTTEEDFLKVLEKDKLAHPAKHAVRLASGDFDRQRIALGIKAEPKVEPKAEKEPKKVK